MKTARTFSTTALTSMVAIMACASSATAEGPSVSTDRPSFGSSASTIPEHMVQLEGGVDVISDDTTAVSLPLFLLRAGVTDMLEVRLGLPSINIQEGEDSLGSVLMGLKFAGPVSDSVSIGLLPYLDFPAGDDSLFDHVTYGATGLLDLGLTESLGLSFNLGLATVERVQEGEGPRQMQQNAALAIGMSFGAGLGAYAEVYQIWQPSFDEVALGVDGGVTYAVAPWLQLDIYANAGIAGDLPSITTGIGIGILGP